MKKHIKTLNLAGKSMRFYINFCAGSKVSSPAG
jgi:hypothetical protein